MSEEASGFLGFPVNFDLLSDFVFFLGTFASFIFRSMFKVFTT